MIIDTAALVTTPTLSPPIVDVMRRAVAALSNVPPANVFDTNACLPVAKDMASFDHGWFVSLKFPDGDALLAALQNGEPTVLAFALQLLLPFDGPKATGLALEAAAMADEGRHALDRHAKRSAASVIASASEHVPLETILAMGLKGVLPDRNQLYAAIVGRPELSSTAARIELFRRLDGESYDYGSFAARLRGEIIAALAKASAPELPPFLQSIWVQPAHPFWDEASEVLFRLAPETVQPLAARGQELVEDAASAPKMRRDALRALIRLGDADKAADLLIPRLSKLESLGLSTAGLLRMLTAEVASGRFPRAHPRWIDAAVAALDDDTLRDPARQLLTQMDKKAVSTALGRANVAAKPAKPPPAKLPKRIDFAARYAAGDHVAVWTELRALGPAVRDPAIWGAAQDVAKETMRRFRASIEKVAAVVAKSNYAFAERKPVVAAKPADATKKLAAIEKLGGALPLSVVAFYQTLQLVDLTENAEAVTDDYQLDPDLGRCDPLVVASLARATGDLKQQILDNKAYLEQLRDPLALYLSPDPRAKYDPGKEHGDQRPTRLRIPEDGADGEVVTREGRIFFVDWLRSYVDRGGFLGLSPAKDGELIAKLRAGVVPF